MNPHNILQGLFDRLFQAWDDFDNNITDPTEETT